MMPTRRTVLSLEEITNGLIIEFLLSLSVMSCLIVGDVEGPTGILNVGDEILRC